MSIKTERSFSPFDNGETPPTVENRRKASVSHRARTARDFSSRNAGWLRCLVRRRRRTALGAPLLGNEAVNVAGVFMSLDSELGSVTEAANPGLSGVDVLIFAH